MRRRIQIREMSAGEQQQLERLSRTRTAPQHQVERARIILGVQRDGRAVTLAEQVGRSVATIDNQVQQWALPSLASCRTLNSVFCLKPVKM